MKNFYLIILTISFFSCASLGEAGKVLRNEKVRNTDEFLVKKKEPLILPPDYNKIPEPGSISKQDKEDSDGIKKIIKKSQGKVKNSKKSSSVENSIIDRINK